MKIVVPAGENYTIPSNLSEVAIKDGLVLEVDTNESECTITLPKSDDYANVPNLKITIIDKGDNATENNILIECPENDNETHANIDGEESFTLSNNGDSVIFERVDLMTWTSSKTVNSGGVALYKVYSALLDQSGTNAPIATVLENTLGSPVTWSYDTVGSYIGTCEGKFTVSKTVVFTGQNYGNQGNEVTYAYPNNNGSEVCIETLDNTDSANGMLGNTFVEIRVYN